MTTSYQFNKINRIQIISQQLYAVRVINSFFAKYQVIVGKPTFGVTVNKVTVHLFYYRSNNNKEIINIALLGNALTRCWNRPIELRLIQLNHVTLDSSIFVHYLISNTKKYSFNRIFDMIKHNLPMVIGNPKTNELPISHITGVKIKLSGRLTTQRSIPRQTIESVRIGSSAHGINGITDYSQHTSKNKLGAYTMKVWISQQSQ